MAAAATLLFRNVSDLFTEAKYERVGISGEKDFVYQNVIVDFGYWFSMKMIKTTSGFADIADLANRVCHWVGYFAPLAASKTVFKIIKTGTKIVSTPEKFILVTHKWSCGAWEAVRNAPGNIQGVGHACHQFATNPQYRKEVVLKVLKVIGDLFIDMESLCSKVTGSIEFVVACGAEAPVLLLAGLGAAGSILGIFSSVASVAKESLAICNNDTEIHKLRTTVEETPLDRREIIQLIENNEAEAKTKIKANVEKDEFLVKANIHYQEVDKTKHTWMIVAQVAIFVICVIGVIALVAPTFFVPGYIIPLALTIMTITLIFNSYCNDRAATWKTFNESQLNKRIDEKKTSLLRDEVKAQQAEADEKERVIREQRAQLAALATPTASDAASIASGAF